MSGRASRDRSQRVFVDTNILIYAHDASAGEKHRRARALVERLWDSRTGVLSTQVLQELAVNLRRKVTPALDSATIREIVADYRAWRVVVNDADSILEALEIEDRHQVSFGDALIVQAAQVSGATLLYSEDLSDGHQYGSVRVCNPLRSEHPDLDLDRPELLGDTDEWHDRKGRIGIRRLGCRPTRQLDGLQNLRR